MKLLYPIKFDSALLQVRDSSGRFIAEVRRFSQNRFEVIELGELIAKLMNDSPAPLPLPQRNPSLQVEAQKESLPHPAEALRQRVQAPVKVRRTRRKV